MTGPFHYLAAENHLRRAADSITGSHEELANLRYAQAHATLANAAANAMSWRTKDAEAWADVAGVGKGGAS